MSCEKGEKFGYIGGYRVSGQEAAGEALQRSTHRSWCHPGGVGLGFVPRGGVAMQIPVTFLHSCMGTAILREAPDSGIKWSWWNARGRDSTQIITISTAWSGLTSFLAGQGNGEEQPLWVSSCFVVGAEQSISESLHQQTLLHTKHICKVFILYSFAVRQKARNGWRQNKGEKKCGRRRLSTSFAGFAAVSTPCIPFFLFSDLNFLEAGEQRAWQEGGVDNTQTLSARGCESVLASCNDKLSWGLLNYT